MFSRVPFFFDHLIKCHLSFNGSSSTILFRLYLCSRVSEMSIHSMLTPSLFILTWIVIFRLLSVLLLDWALRGGTKPCSCLYHRLGPGSVMFIHMTRAYHALLRSVLSLEHFVFRIGLHGILVWVHGLWSQSIEIMYLLLISYLTFPSLSFLILKMGVIRLNELIFVKSLEHCMAYAESVF